MGLYVEFDVSDYGYGNQVQGTVAGMFPIYTTMDFAPACEAFVKTFIEVATELVPVRTGYLKSTISATTDGMVCKAEATAEYAEYVEYGTWCMSAQPYFTPALEIAMEAFHRVAERIQREINAEYERIMQQQVQGMQAQSEAGLVSSLFAFLFALLVASLLEILKEFFDDIFDFRPLPEIVIT